MTENQNLAVASNIAASNKDSSSSALRNTDMMLTTGTELLFVVLQVVQNSSLHEFGESKDPASP